MIKKIVLGVLGVMVIAIVVFVIVVAMQPAEYSVSRSGAMPAPPAEVFPHVNDFHNWNDWSPWAKLDPSAKYTYEGAESGEGAKFTWDGNDQVGKGNMVITKSVPDELIQMELNFISPWEGSCDVEFKFAPVDDNQTEVTWIMSGQNDFIGKAMCLFMGDMDGMIGPYYEEGLANMKKVIETADNSQSDEASDGNNGEPDGGD